MVCGRTYPDPEVGHGPTRVRTRVPDRGRRVWPPERPVRHCSRPRPTHRPLTQPRCSRASSPGSRCKTGKRRSAPTTPNGRPADCARQSLGAKAVSLSPTIIDLPEFVQPPPAWAIEPAGPAAVPALVFAAKSGTPIARDRTLPARVNPEVLRTWKLNHAPAAPATGRPDPFPGGLGLAAPGAGPATHDGTGDLRPGSDVRFAFDRDHVSTWPVRGYRIRGGIGVTRSDPSSERTTPEHDQRVSKHTVGPGAGRVPRSGRGRPRRSELPQEAEVVRPEQADVVDRVLEHQHPLRPHPEREPGHLVGVVPAVP